MEQGMMNDEVTSPITCVHGSRATRGDLDRFHCLCAAAIFSTALLFVAGHIDGGSITYYKVPTLPLFIFVNFI